MTTMNMNEKDMRVMASTICTHIMKGMTQKIDDNFGSWETKNAAGIAEGQTVIEGLLATIKDMAQKMDEMKAQIDGLQAGKVTKAKKTKAAETTDGSEKPKVMRKKSGYIRYGMAMRAKAKTLDSPPKLSISQFGQMWRAESEDTRAVWNNYAKDFTLTEKDAEGNSDWKYSGDASEPETGDVCDLLTQIGSVETIAAATAPPKPIDPIEAVGTKESKFYKMGDIRAELERRGLEGGGRKPAKIDRLKQAMRAEQAQAQASDLPELDAADSSDSSDSDDE